MRILSLLKELYEIYQDKQETEVETEEDDNIAFFSFEIKNNGELIISCDWDKDYQNPEMAMILGGTLKMITSGVYNPLIANIIIESVKDKEDPSDVEFVKKMLAYWNTTTNGEVSDPIIDPLKTFAESNFLGNNR